MRPGGVETSNEKVGYWEGSMGGRIGPMLLKIQETTNSKETGIIHLVPFILHAGLFFAMDQSFIFNIM